MRCSFLPAVLLGILLFNPWFLNAFEIEFTGGMNNMTFHPDRDTAHSKSTNFKQFPGYPLGVGNLSFSG